ncbi:hypothetical protein MMC28_001616 [Mycoblastus sanguinarius]|nr:hypothetical protein [Mycoblastus sanguinarius]
MPMLLDFPNELLLICIQFVRPDDIVNLSLESKRFSDLAKDRLEAQNVCTRHTQSQTKAFMGNPTRVPSNLKVLPQEIMRGNEAVFLEKRQHNENLYGLSFLAD